MSQSDHAPAGIAVRLRDVRTVRIRALAWGKDDEPPEWTKDKSGNVKLAALDDGNVVAELSATFTQNLIGVAISLQGLYEVDPQSDALHPAEDDSQSMLARIPDGYRQQLAALAGFDLFPFIRHAFLTTSLQLDPRSRILLAPLGQWDFLMTE